MSENSVIPEGDGTQVDDDAVSRLGIRHLILWGVATAGVMSIFSTIRLINGELVRTRFHVFELVGGIAYGAALAGILVGLSRWRKGKRVAVHPGHWFLYLAGIAMLLDLGLTLGLTLWAQAHDRTLVSYFYHRQLMGHGISAVILMGALVRSRCSPLWCLPMGALLLLSLSQVLGSSLILVHAWRPFVQQHRWLAPQKMFLPLVAVGAATILLVAVIDARRTGERRDWMHWAGVGVFVAIAAPFLVDAVLGWL